MAISLFNKFLQELNDHGYRMDQIESGIAAGVEMSIEKFKAALEFKEQINGRFLPPTANLIVLMKDGFCFQRRFHPDGEQYWHYRNYEVVKAE